MTQLFPCRLCGTLTLAQSWGGGECPACESVSMPLLPRMEELAEFYARYNDTYSGGGVSEGRNLQRYAQRYLRLVRHYCNTGSLIDVGSSNNPFPNIAAGHGFHTTMLDFEKPRCLADGIDYVKGSLNDQLPAALIVKQFDVVTCWAVMEHVPDTQAAAARLAALVKRGGYLFMSTPEAGTALTRYSAGRSPWFYPPEHLTLISPQAFKRVFQPLGFESVTWGRLELSSLRFAARYGVGLAEACAGALLKRMAPAAWLRLRIERKQRFQGVAYFVFRKLT